MTRSLGIDVGSSLIRLAEIETHGRTRRLVGLYELTRESGVSPGTQLRAFFENSGITGERIGLGTSAQPLIVRAFEFPFSNIKKVEAAIYGDFEDSLPFDISNHILEIRPTGKAGKMSRFLAGLMPRDSVAQIDGLAEESGVLVNAYFSDVEALAQLALNQNLPAGTTGNPYAVCDLGYSTAKIAFLRGSRPQFANRKLKETVPGQILEVRTIHRGSGELVQWIREKNGLSLEEALQWLIHRAEIQSDEGKGDSLTSEISDAIKTALRPVVVELYQTLQSFKNDAGTLPFAVYLTGGLSGLKGLKEFLSDELRVPFHSWPIFEGFHTEAIPLTMERERSFGVALAIAHRWSYTASGGWLNFKRMTAQKKLLSSMLATFAQPDIKRVVMGMGFAAAAVIGYQSISTALLSMQSSSLQKEVVGEFTKIDKDLGKRAVKFSADPKRSREIFEQERKKKLSTEGAKLTGNGPTGHSRTEVFLDISETLPSGAILKELTVNEASQGLSVQSSFAPKEAPNAEITKRTLEQLSNVLRSRGYADISLDTSPSDRKLLVMKAKWKGAAQ
ncbi:MAG: hypothetical protein JST16_11330 [Bdellovibrionales bacterium]|nr:hypothetical protein [Bdellovibrionales bacterium]